MTTRTPTRGDRVYHLGTDSYGDVLGATTPGHVWVWFDDESEPNSVVTDEVEVLL